MSRIVINNYSEQSIIALNSPAEVRQQWLVSVALMLLSSIFIALVSLLAKQTTLIVGLSLSLILRFVLPLIVLTLVLTITKVRLRFSASIRLHIYRALFITVSQFCLFYYLQSGSLMNGTLLVNTSPIFIMLINVMFFKRSVNKLTWLSLGLGMFATVCLLQPNHGLLHGNVTIGLSAGLFSAAAQLLNHKLSQYENEVMICWHLYFFCTLMICALFLIIPHHYYHLPMLITLLTEKKLYLYYAVFIISSFSSQVLRSRAYAHVVSAASLAPFLLVSVLMASILDWCVYHVLPDGLSLFGAGLMGASIIMGIYQR